MNKNKKEILLLPCYEHDVREYVKRCNAHIPLTPVYKLTPEEELEFQEEERRGRLLDKLELGEPINKQELTQDEKFLVWKNIYQRKGVQKNVIKQDYIKR